MNEINQQNPGIPSIAMPNLKNQNQLDEQGYMIVKSFHFYLIIVNILLILFNVMLTEYLWYLFKRNTFIFIH